MEIVKFIELIQKNARTARNVFIAWIAVVLIFDIVQSRAEAHFLIDKIYVFWSIFGAVGCFLLIKAAKGLAHLFLAKDEDFYG